MKMLKKFAAVAISSALIMSFAGIQASATSSDYLDEYIKAEITTDKETYEDNENITATLKVTNQGEKLLKNLKLDQIAPEGYTVVKDKGSTRRYRRAASLRKAVNRRRAASLRKAASLQQYQLLLRQLLQQLLQPQQHQLLLIHPRQATVQWRLQLSLL